MIFRPDLSALVGSPKQTNKEVKRANQSVRLCAANKSLFSAADTESRGDGGGGVWVGGWSRAAQDRHGSPAQCGPV